MVFRNLHNRTGQELVEYVILLALFMSVTILAARLFPTALTIFYTEVSLARSGIVGMRP